MNICAWIVFGLYVGCFFFFFFFSFFFSQGAVSFNLSPMLDLFSKSNLTYLFRFYDFFDDFLQPHAIDLQVEEQKSISSRHARTPGGNNRNIRFC